MTFTPNATEAPYITARALISVIDTLVTSASRGVDTSVHARFGASEPTVEFSLLTPEDALAAAVRRPFLWFVRRNADAFADLLDGARNAARADGTPQTVDLSGFRGDTGWPQLMISVRPDKQETDPSPQHLGTCRRCRHTYLLGTVCGALNHRQ